MAISDVPGDPESLPVDLFQNTLSADYPELLAMSVIGEGFHDVAAGMHEILMHVERGTAEVSGGSRPSRPH